MDNQKNQEKSISEQLSDILPRLSKDQLRFVVAMQELPSKGEAAESIGLKPDTVYRWPRVVNKAIKLIALDITESAKIMRKQSLAKAMAVKLAALDSDDEKVRQAAASEIIEWELGKAKQALEHTGEDGKPIEIIEVVKHDGSVSEE